MFSFSTFKQHVAKNKGKSAQSSLIYKSHFEKKHYFRNWNALLRALQLSHRVSSRSRDNKSNQIKRCLIHLSQTENDHSLFQSKVINLSPTLIVHSSSEKGLRKTQEDTSSAFILTGCQHLADYQLANVFALTLKKLQKQIKGLNTSGGSTFTGSIQRCIDRKTQIITANIGDSTTLLFKRKSSEDPYRGNLLTWEHSVKDKEEAIRLKGSGAEISGDKIVIGRNENGEIETYLAMSRALGDLRYENKGLSHEADFSYELDEEDDGFLLHVCDGVTDVLSVIDLEYIVNFADKPERPKVYKGRSMQAVQALLDTVKKEASTLPEIIRDIAFLKGSSDNITVTQVPIVKQESEEAVVSFVADGHGGAQVSEYIEKHLFTVMNNILAIYPLKEVMHEIRHRLKIPQYPDRIIDETLLSGLEITKKIIKDEIKAKFASGASFSQIQACSEVKYIQDLSHIISVSCHENTSQNTIQKLEAIQTFEEKWKDYIFPQSNLLVRTAKQNTLLRAFLIITAGCVGAVLGGLFGGFICSAATSFLGPGAAMVGFLGLIKGSAAGWGLAVASASGLVGVYSTTKSLQSLFSLSTKEATFTETTSLSRRYCK